MTHLLGIGLGYSARALARRRAADGWRITGTSRTEDGVAAIQGNGSWRGIQFDGISVPSALTVALGEATHMLVSTPPADGRDPVLARLDATLAAAPQVRWIGYLSSVGVYGDHHGGWVDETTPCAPVAERARWRLAAEREWLAFGERTGTRVEIFRLPGIYGPGVGRNALDNLKAGKARRVVKPGQVFNRVHVDDIAGALSAAMDRPPVHAIYNVTDDLPSPTEDVIEYAATLLGISAPPPVSIADANLSPMAASFYNEVKRVSNARMKTDLGYQPLYPTYREGLTAILSVH